MSWEEEVADVGGTPPWSFNRRFCTLRLENWRFEEWGDQVTVVSCDMREWAAPEKADIIVSELLGSFGDNELSPECLDGAQHFLKGALASFLYFVSYSKKRSALISNALILSRGWGEHPFFLHLLPGPPVLLKALQ